MTEGTVTGGAGVLPGHRGLGPDLQWLARILWGLDVTLTVGPEAPEGHIPLERYVVVPSLARARFLVPAGPAAAAGAALSSYNRLRAPVIRAARSLLAAGFWLGAAPRLFRDRVTISVPTSAAAAGSSLLQHIRAALGEENLVAAIGLRPPGPYTKPVLQLFAPNGRPRGYVKVGWNDLTRALVRTEAGFLTAHGERPFRTFTVPRLRHHGRWRDLEISVVAPLPSDVGPYRPRHRPPPPSVTAEIAALSGIREEPLAAARYWSRLRASVEVSVARRPRGDGEVVRGCVRRIERRYGAVRLPFGSWHGDWVPWNMARHRGRLAVWDWEQRSDDAPRGFDELHFLFQLPFAWRRRPLPETVIEWRRRSPAVLEAVRVPPDARPAVMASYLLELFVRYAGAEQVGAGRHPRFFPEILRVLDREPRSA